jgi:hypothetical protein
MIGNLEPEENVMSSAWLGQLSIALEKLGWDQNDEIRVKIGGVANSGIHQTEGANPKWAKPFGTVSYQNDAFIVIENVTRNPVVPSQPNPDLKQAHEYTGKETD